MSHWICKCWMRPQTEISTSLKPTLNPDTGGSQWSQWDANGESGNVSGLTTKSQLRLEPWPPVWRLTDWRWLGYWGKERTHNFWDRQDDKCGNQENIFICRQSQKYYCCCLICVICNSVLPILVCNFLQLLGFWWECLPSQYNDT